MLAARGLTAPLPSWDPREIEAEQEAHDPSCLPSYRIAALAARHYPSVLRGEESGERALFAADHMEAWAAYFSNDNPAYAISNRIAALPAARALAEAPGAVLELGGGLGSAGRSAPGAPRADRALGRGPPLPVHGDLVPVPAPRAATLSRTFGETPLELARLDIDRPFAEGA
jgi:hypothetical protein